MSSYRSITMLKEIEHNIDENQVNMRLDVVVKEIANISRSYAQKLINQGFVWVNDAQMSNSYKVSEDDTVFVQIPKSEALELVPVDMNLDVVYEDHDVIVINKPVGMV